MHSACALCPCFISCLAGDLICVECCKLAATAFENVPQIMHNALCDFFPPMSSLPYQFATTMKKKKTSEGNLFLIASALPFAAANGDVEAPAVAKGAFRAPRNKNSAPLASQKLDGAVRICAGGYKLSPPLFIPMSKHLF